jgi:hypothetical protein
VLRAEVASGFAINPRLIWQPRHGLEIRVEFCLVENYLTGPMHGDASGGKLRNAVYNGQSEDTGKP